MFERIKNWEDKNALKFDTFTIIGIFLLIITGVKATWHLASYMDVLFWDESMYLDRGLDMFKIIPKAWGPVYSLWYKFLSYFIHDRIALYYFNFKLTSVLVSVLLYLVMLSMGVQRILAFIFALFFLSSYLNVPVWPHVSHFVVIVILAGVLIAKFHRTLLLKLMVLSVAFFIVTYARPEMFFAFLLFYLISFVLFWLKVKRLNRLEIFYFVTLTIVVLVLSKKLGTPLNSGDTMRSIGVFLQHYAWRYSEEHHLNNVFWLEFYEMDKREFGDISSIRTIIHNHPDLFYRHIFMNAKQYFWETGKLIVNFFLPIFTQNIHWLCLMISVFIFVIYFNLNKKTAAFKERLKVLFKNNWLSLIVMFTLAGSAFIVCIYAYPRDHYLFLQVPFLMTAISLVISSISIEKDISYSKLFVLFVVWFFVTPESEDFHYFKLMKSKEELSNLHALQYLKKQYPSDSVRIFDTEGSVKGLLPKNFKDYNSDYYKDSLLLPSDFIKQKEIDVIYVSPSFRKFKKNATDTVLTKIINQPENYGYLPVKIDASLELLIRKK